MAESQDTSTIMYNILRPDQFQSLIYESVISGLQKMLPKETVSDDQLLKIDDVCEIFKVSKTTIHAWKRKGLMPFLRISDKIYFRKTDVLAAMHGVNLAKFNQKQKSHI